MELPYQENIITEEVTALGGNPDEFLTYYVLLIQIREIGGFRFVSKMELPYKENSRRGNSFTIGVVSFKHKELTNYNRFSLNSVTATGQFFTA